MTKPPPSTRPLAAPHAAAIRPRTPLATIKTGLRAGTGGGTYYTGYVKVSDD